MNLILDVGDNCICQGEFLRVISIVLDYFGLDDELTLSNGKKYMSSEVTKAP